MRRIFLVAVIAALVAWGPASAADFKPYPGAKLDEEATEEAMEALAAAKVTSQKVAIYTTGDSFAEVVAFYKGLAKEYAMPGKSGSTGKPVKFEDEEETYDLWEAFFIFDGASDIKDSRLWIKIQRPYIGGEVRDVTAIVVSEKTK